MGEAQWSDRDRVEQFIHNNPGIVTDLLAKCLGQAELDSLFQGMFPPATDYQRRIALNDARQILMRADYAPASEGVRWIDAELGSIAEI